MAIGKLKITRVVHIIFLLDSSVSDSLNKGKLKEPGNTIKKIYSHLKVTRTWSEIKEEKFHTIKGVQIDPSLKSTSDPRLSSHSKVYFQPLIRLHTARQGWKWTCHSKVSRLASLNLADSWVKVASGSLPRRWGQASRIIVSVRPFPRWANEKLIC